MIGKFKARTIVRLVELYCIISGIIFIIISILSIASFACAFDFTGGPLSYMMYLLYFRRSSCHAYINWDVLGINDKTPHIKPNMPPETAAVIRTLIFSIFYLVLNALLIAAALRAMSGVNVTSKNKNIVFWSFYSPLFIIYIAIIVMDFLSSGFYIFEFFLLMNSSGNAMRILEIKNDYDFEEYFKLISASTRQLPSMLFFLVTSKFILVLILNITIIYTFYTAVWKVCRENQKQLFEVEKNSKIKKASPVMSMKSLDGYDEAPPSFSTFARSAPKKPAPIAPQMESSQPASRTNTLRSNSQAFNSTLDIRCYESTNHNSMEPEPGNGDGEEKNVPRLSRDSYENSVFKNPKNHKTHI